MTRKELIKRYFVFFIGLLLTSFGVAFVTKTSLGTSPIAAIPYSLSLVLPQLSMGTWVVLFNLLLVVIQCLIERKNAVKFQVLFEVIIAFLFGYGVDLSMLCLQFLSPEHYVAKLISLVIGSGILAFGAFLEVTANVTMLPGDAFVNAIARPLHKEFGGVRTVSDLTMAILAAVICLLCLHKLSGVREGTIIAALLVGNLVRLYARIFSGAARKWFV